jgi:hypothetical protein
MAVPYLADLIALGVLGGKVSEIGDKKWLLLLMRLGLRQRHQ